MSHRNAMPKLVAPPPPHIHARQPIRLTARVAVFTVNGGGGDHRSMKQSFIHQVNVRNCQIFVQGLQETVARVSSHSKTHLNHVESFTCHR